jgi:hypothetical protein
MLALVLATCLAFTVDLWSQDEPKVETAGARTGWQHLALAHPSEKEWNDRELAQQINKLGREGWGLVSVLNFAKDGTTRNTIYYFKKPL